MLASVSVPPVPAEAAVRSDRDSPSLGHPAASVWPPGAAMPIWIIVYAFHTIDPPARPIALVVVGCFMVP